MPITKKIPMGTLIPKMDIKEFVEKGYLQELNRQFLHPLGLALEVQIGNENNYSLSGIWDYRNDPEGIYFDYENSDPARIERAKLKRDFVDLEFAKRSILRKEILGFGIEPIAVETIYKQST